MPTPIPPRLLEALRGAMTPKFLATIGPEGDPNVVPVISIQPWDEATLVFGEYLMFKTRRNLLANPRVGVLVVTEALEAWTLRGTFEGFETSGEKFDAVNRGELLRYNAYTGIRAAGSIRVEAVEEIAPIGKAEVLAGWLKAAVLRPLLAHRSAAPRLPRAVAEKFARIQALRACAFVGEGGFPRVEPTLSCFAAGRDRLVIADRTVLPHARELEQAKRVAVCVLTFDPIAYQVKGNWAGVRGGLGVVDLTECYSASPPRVGARLA